MCTVVGIKKVVSKKDGQIYYELHMIGEDHYVEGQIAFSVFVRADQIVNLPVLSVGSIVELCYNRFAKIDHLTVL